MHTNAQPCTAHCYCRSRTDDSGRRVRYCCWCGTEQGYWKRVGPGVYDSADGLFTMYRIEGARPYAWNVEWTTDYSYAHRHSGDTVDTSVCFQEEPVDGAASMRDAMALHTQWLARHADELAAL